MPDHWERAHHLRVGVNDANRDADRDHLSNRGEFRAHTDPQDPDTNNNCVGDAAEDPDGDHVDNGNEVTEHTQPA